MDVSNVAFQMDNFIYWLELSTSKPSMRQLLRFYRQTRNAKFLELCRVHLSFLLDSSRDGLEGSQDEVRRCGGGGSGCNEATMMASGKDPATCLKEAVGTEKKRFFRSLIAKLFKRSKDPKKLSAEGGSVIGRLIKHLMCHRGMFLSHNALAASSTPILVKICTISPTTDTLVEGVFRKAGNLSKQKLLKKQLTSELSPLINLSEHSVHDLACVLKSLLVDWPLLTEEIRRVFLAMSQQQFPLDCQEDSEDEREYNSDNDRLMQIDGKPNLPSIPGYSRLLNRLSLAKRKKGYRLLCLLLPDDKRELFLSLLRLLHRVAKSPITRMTPTTLGTLFGPLLLASPRDTPALTLRDKYRVYGDVLRDLITMAEELDEIPVSLLVDIERNLNLARTVGGSCSSLELFHLIGSNEGRSDYLRLAPPIPPSTISSIEDHALDTCVRFATSPSCCPGSLDAPPSSSASTISRHGQTNLELSRLLGVIHKMPESSEKKRRYLRRLNRTVQSRSPYPEKAVTMAAYVPLHRQQAERLRLYTEESLMGPAVEKRRAGMKRFLSSCVSKTRIPHHLDNDYSYSESAVQATPHTFPLYSSNTSLCGRAEGKLNIDGEDRETIPSSFSSDLSTPLIKFKRWKSQTCGPLDRAVAASSLPSPRPLTDSSEDSNSAKSLKFGRFISPQISFEDTFSYTSPNLQQSPVILASG